MREPKMSKCQDLTKSPFRSDSDHLRENSYQRDLLRILKNFKEFTFKRIYRRYYDSNYPSTFDF